jgi:hypothetical protein
MPQKKHKPEEITADLPAATRFLSSRLLMNTGTTAAAVAYDGAGVYPETDFWLVVTAPRIDESGEVGTVCSKGW